MLYKNLFQLYPDNFQNNYFLLSDKLEDIYDIITCVCKDMIGDIVTGSGKTLTFALTIVQVLSNTVYNSG